MSAFLVVITKPLIMRQFCLKLGTGQKVWGGGGGPEHLEMWLKKNT